MPERLPRRAVGTFASVVGTLRFLAGAGGWRHVDDGIGEALPDLDADERRRFVRDAYIWETGRRARERRAARTSDAALCKYLDYGGWEHLHDTDSAVFLLAPLGSVQVARRAVEAYHPGYESITLWDSTENEDVVEATLLGHPVGCDAGAVRRAMHGGLAVWIVALPLDGRRWSLSLTPGVAAGAGRSHGGDSGGTIPSPEAFLEGCLSRLEERIRRHPSCWRWSWRNFKRRSS